MTIRKYLVGLAVAAIAAIGSVTGASASTILVGQCFEFELCWTDPGPSLVSFSTNLDGAQLASVTDSNSPYIPMFVGQTSQYVIQLSDLQAVFQTPDGPMTQTLDSFSGPNSHTDPCIGFCEPPTLLGYFDVPDGATSAVISGDFGNGPITNSAAECVWVGSGDPPVCTAVRETPEPVTLTLFGAGLAGAVAMRRRKKAA
jgi:PEP-CTERM motif